MNFEHLFSAAAKHAKAEVAAKRADGEDVSLPFGEFLAEAERLAQTLARAGLGKGLQIGLQASNCYEYLLWDLAAIKLGAVIHAVPEELGAERLAAIHQKQAIALWVCEKDEHVAALPHALNIAATRKLAAVSLAPGAAPVADADLHSRVYSSGSSGYLKGLNIGRHGTELLVSDFIADFGLCESDSHLIFLPLSNYQQRLSVYGCLWAGASFKVIRHTTVFMDLGRYKPSFIIAPPAIYENVYNLNARAADAKERVAAFLGGNIRFMITGMAPIRLDVLKWFNDAGFRLLEAYGVTETGMIAWSTLSHQRLGSVGRPIHPEHVEFTAESEIVIRRPFPLSKGYFDSAESDSAATFLADGSIATGDIGKLDADGYLTLNGRKKEIIVTSGGAKFHPEEIERALSGIAGVRNAVALMAKNDGRLVAVLTVAGAQDAATVAAVEAGVQLINASLPSYKNVHRWVLTETAPSIENGMLTRNLKSDRKGVYRHFQAEIERQAEAVAP